MTTLATACLLIVAACLIPCLYRLAVGPHALDRLVAFDLTAVLIALAIAIYAIVQQSWVYLEISMGLAVLSLVGTVAVAHYIGNEQVF